MCCWHKRRLCSPAHSQERISAPLFFANANILVTMPRAEVGNKHGWKVTSHFSEEILSEVVPRSGSQSSYTAPMPGRRKGSEEASVPASGTVNLCQNSSRSYSCDLRAESQPSNTGKWKPAFQLCLQHIPQYVHRFFNSSGMTLHWWWMRIMPLLGMVIYPTPDFKHPLKT